MQKCTTVAGCLGVGALILLKAIYNVIRACSYPSNEKDGVLGCVSTKSLTAFAPPPGCLGAGAAAGRALALRMKITELPQTVAAFHSLVCSRAFFHHIPGTHVPVKTSSGSSTTCHDMPPLRRC